jgi:surface antigen
MGDGNNASPGIRAPQNYLANNYAQSNPGIAAQAMTSAGGALGSAAGGAIAGAAAGSVVPILGTVLGAAGGAIIGGIFSLIGTNMQTEEARRQQAEAREMAERQFAWGQKMDRFGMDMQTKQFDHAVSQDRVSQLKGMIQSDAALQDRLRSLYSTGRK